MSPPMLREAIEPPKNSSPVQDIKLSAIADSEKMMK